MRVTDIVNSAKLTVGQIFSCPTVQHFQFELLRVSAALTHETGTAMVLVCRHPTSDEAVSDAVFGCEDFVSPFAREVVPNHFQFEPEVEFPHMPSKVVSNSWGSVHSRCDSVRWTQAELQGLMLRMKSGRHNAMKRSAVRVAAAPPAKPRLLMLNKPFDVLTQFSDDQGRATLKDYVDVPG